MASTEFENIYHDTIVNDDDLYSNLMKREEKVLDIVNRVIDQKEQTKNDKTVLEMGLRQIVLNTFTTLKNVSRDLSSGNSINLRSQNRQVYIGFFITFVTITLIILYKLEE